LEFLLGAKEGIFQHTGAFLKQSLRSVFCEFPRRPSREIRWDLQFIADSSLPIRVMVELALILSNYTYGGDHFSRFPQRGQRGTRAGECSIPQSERELLDRFPTETRTRLWSYVHMVYNAEVMRLLRSWRYARGTPLLARVILLCSVACFALLPTEFEVSTALTAAHSPPPVQEAYECYLAVPQEAEDSDMDPVKADLLTALLVIACFGAIVGWLLTNGRRQRAFRFVGLDHGPSWVSALEDRSFLGMFLL
jgi:hypothetical protein